MHIMYPTSPSKNANTIAQDTNRSSCPMPKPNPGCRRHTINISKNANKEKKNPIPFSQGMVTQRKVGIVTNMTNIKARSISVISKSRRMKFSNKRQGKEMNNLKLWTTSRFLHFCCSVTKSRCGGLTAALDASADYELEAL
jgi:hypothetical protein